MTKHSKLSVLFLFLLFAAFVNAVLAQNDEVKPNDVNEIRFDGLYRTKQITDKHDGGYKYYSYLRFCENGTVIGMSSSFDAKRVSKWLLCETEKQKYSVGKYSVNDNHISFTTKSENGKVDYEGAIEEKSIKLNIYSQITKNSEQNRKYKFIRVSFDKE